MRNKSLWMVSRCRDKIRIVSKVLKVALRNILHEREERLPIAYLFTRNLLQANFAGITDHYYSSNSLKMFGTFEVWEMSSSISYQISLWTHRIAERPWNPKLITPATIEALASYERIGHRFTTKLRCSRRSSRNQKFCAVHRIFFRFQDKNKTRCLFSEFNHWGCITHKRLERRCWILVIENLKKKPKATLMTQLVGRRQAKRKLVMKRIKNFTRS